MQFSSSENRLSVGSLVWSGGEGEGVRFAYFEPPTGASIVESRCARPRPAWPPMRAQAVGWDGGDPVRELGG